MYIYKHTHTHTHDIQIYNFLVLFQISIIWAKTLLTEILYLYKECLYE